VFVCGVVSHLTLALWEGQETLRRAIIQRWLGGCGGKIVVS